MTNKRPLVILVSGFLGSGKTTLMLAAAERLRAAGMKIGVITNDQGGELVDTRFIEASGFDAEEVGGGCFCCKFSDFMASAERLLEKEPDVILSEPVGSCTDLSATIAQPLKSYYGDRFRLAPLTVLVDPARAADVTAPDADPNVSFLFWKQLAEADQVWYSKADLFAECPQIPGVPARRLSAVSGEGVAEWLREVFDEDAAAGARLLDIDYQKYADAEAALGWLNWRAELRLKQWLTPAAVVGPLLEDLDECLTKAGARIAHLKIFNQAESGYIKASICRNSDEPWVDGALDASPARRHDLVLNLRAVSEPALLESIVRGAMGRLPGKLTTRHFECFSPSPPKPEHRFDTVV